VDLDTDFRGKVSDRCATGKAARSRWAPERGPTPLHPAGYGDAAAAPHPWIERDPVSGARSLRLPPPQTARRLADFLLVIVDSRRGTRAGD
jgi:hypothetical protein